MWENFAIQLGFEFGEIKVLKRMPDQLDVEECSEKMLQKWWTAHPTHNVAELITALRGIEQNSYAHQLEKG